MRKIVHKCYGLWNVDKEEKWLNEMAAKGLCLISYGFCRYEFEECLPGEYEIRIQLLDHPCRHPENERYIAFLEETGVEQVGSYMRWVYFRKKTAGGAFELFSDYPSRIRQLTQVLRFTAVLGGLNLVCGFVNLYLYFGYGNSGNLIGLINLALGVLLAFGVFKLYRKRKHLQKEQKLFE